MLLGWSTTHPDAFCFLLPAALFTKDSLPIHLAPRDCSYIHILLYQRNHNQVYHMWLLRKVNEFVVTAMASTLHGYATSSK